MTVLLIILAIFIGLKVVGFVLCGVVAYLEPELFSEGKKRLKSLNRMLGRCKRCKNFCIVDGCNICTRKNGCKYNN